MADKFAGWQDAKRPTETELEEALMGQDRGKLATEYRIYLKRKIDAGEPLSPEEAYVAKTADFSAWMSNPLNFFGSAGAATALSPALGYGPMAPFASPLAGMLMRANLATTTAGLGMGALTAKNVDKYGAYYQHQRMKDKLSHDPVQGY